MLLMLLLLLRGGLSMRNECIQGGDLLKNGIENGEDDEVGNRGSEGLFCGPHPIIIKEKGKRKISWESVNKTAILL